MYSAPPTPQPSVSAASQSQTLHGLKSQQIDAINDMTEQIQAINVLLKRIGTVYDTALHDIRATTALDRHRDIMESFSHRRRHITSDANPYPGATMDRIFRYVARSFCVPVSADRRDTLQTPAVCIPISLADAVERWDPSLTAIWQSFNDDDNAFVFSRFLHRLRDIENDRVDRHLSASVVCFLQQLTDHRDLREQCMLMSRDTIGGSDDSILRGFNRMTSGARSR